MGHEVMAMLFQEAPCSVMVDTWAVKGLPYSYHDFGVYVYTIRRYMEPLGVVQGSGSQGSGSC